MHMSRDNPIQVQPLIVEYKVLCSLINQQWYMLPIPTKDKKPTA